MLNDMQIEAFIYPGDYEDARNVQTMSALLHKSGKGYGVDYVDGEWKVTLDQRIAYDMMDDDRDQCPQHGVQRIVDYSSTQGPDPHTIHILTCGHGVACFGPGASNVIVTEYGRSVR